MMKWSEFVGNILQWLRSDLKVGFKKWEWIVLVFFFEFLIFKRVFDEHKLVVAVRLLLLVVFFLLS